MQRFLLHQRQTGPLPRHLFQLPARNTLCRPAVTHFFTRLVAREMITNSRGIKPVVFHPESLGDRSILESPVLYQLRIQTTVPRMIDLFEKNTVHTCRYIRSLPGKIHFDFPVRFRNTSGCQS